MRYNIFVRENHINNRGRGLGPKWSYDPELILERPVLKVADEIRDTFEGGQHVILKAPTASGKLTLISYGLHSVSLRKSIQTMVLYKGLSF